MKIVVLVNKKDDNYNIVVLDHSKVDYHDLIDCSTVAMKLFEADHCPCCHQDFIREENHKFMQVCSEECLKT